jgi:hypothetical protein
MDFFFEALLRDDQCVGCDVESATPSTCVPLRLPELRMNSGDESIIRSRIIEIGGVGWVQRLKVLSKVTGAMVSGERDGRESNAAEEERWRDHLQELGWMCEEGGQQDDYEQTLPHKIKVK